MPPSPAQPVSLHRDHLRFGHVCRLSFQRTLRVPLQRPGTGGGGWPLPPGLGLFPIYRVREYAERLPAAWRGRHAFFIPLYQREALWIAFDSAPDTLCAVEIGAGGVNVISGESFAAGLTAQPQNYVVVPEQPWLDGIHTGQGVVRQFVAMPLGKGVTVEAQIAGAERAGGLQIRVYPAKPGLKPRVRAAARALGMPVSMGIAAGGEIRQKIYPDPYGIDAWDAGQCVEVSVYLLNSAQFRQATGLKPPPTPIKPHIYTKYGFPWFALYDEHRAGLSGSGKLSKVRPAGQVEGWKEQPLTIDEGQIRKLR